MTDLQMFAVIWLLGWFYAIVYSLNRCPEHYPKTWKDWRLFLFCTFLCWPAIVVMSIRL